jgi:hypothetical protein
VAQDKIIASEHTIERFKRIVLAKRGKLQLSAEGEEALRMYIKKYENLLGGLRPADKDPLAKICGISRSSSPRNLLRDLEKLEREEL